MIKTELKIDGMMCGMCEAHINDVIRKTFPVRSVTSSHTKGLTQIVSEAPLEEEQLRKAIAETGYTLQSVTAAPYEKKRFSFFKK